MICLFCTGSKEISMRKIGVRRQKLIFALVCEQNITLPYAKDYECFHRMMTGQYKAVVCSLFPTLSGLLSTHLLT